MARFSLMLGKNRDAKLSNTVYLLDAAAGSAADYERAVTTVPNLNQLTPIPTGAQGDLVINALSLRSLYLMPTTTITGGATNFVTVFINARRNLGINTTVAATQTSGAGKVLTPASMNNIQVGSVLLIDTVASGVQETAAVTAVTGTTFTVTLANGHTGPFPIVNTTANATSQFYALPVNTTSATTIVASTMAVTPLTMSNIGVGTVLYLSAGTGAAETVVVQSTTATTFTATFVNGHSGAYTIVSAPLASVSYNATTVISTAGVPTLLNPYPGNTLLAGDTITIQRISSNATGLSLGTCYLEFEWVPARIGR